MESHYNYFNRDISWLSFNHRVLLEADDDTLPLFERINFIAIYSSNLEEFYQVRVAEHKAVASGGKSEDMTVDEAHALIRQITDTVNRQLEDRVRIYEEKHSQRDIASRSGASHQRGTYSNHHRAGQQHESFLSGPP